MRRPSGAREALGRDLALGRQGPVVVDHVGVHVVVLVLGVDHHGVALEVLDDLGGPDGAVELVGHRVGARALPGVALVVRADLDLDEAGLLGRLHVLVVVVVRHHDLVRAVLGRVHVAEGLPVDVLLGVDRAVTVRVGVEEPAAALPVELGLVADRELDDAGAQRVLAVERGVGHAELPVEVDVVPVALDAEPAVVVDPVGPDLLGAGVDVLAVREAAGVRVVAVHVVAVADRQAADVVVAVLVRVELVGHVAVEVLVVVAQLVAVLVDAVVPDLVRVRVDGRIAVVAVLAAALVRVGRHAVAVHVARRVLFGVPDVAGEDRVADDDVGGGHEHAGDVAPGRLVDGQGDLHQHVAPRGEREADRVRGHGVVVAADRDAAGADDGVALGAGVGQLDERGVLARRVDVAELRVRGLQAAVQVDVDVGAGVGAGALAVVLVERGHAADGQQAEDRDQGGALSHDVPPSGGAEGVLGRTDDRADHGNLLRVVVLVSTYRYSAQGRSLDY